MENSYTRWLEIQEEKAAQIVEDLLEDGKITEEDREAVEKDIYESFIR
jgi:polyhydroxyalkanoate synthesis regulator phasin